MKSIRTNPANHAAEGDERIRTAVPAPSTDPVYGRRKLVDYGRSEVGCASLGPVRYLVMWRLTLIWRAAQ